jgi:pimeloyl-ACP methyl ester carboxylesterase
VLIPIEVLFYNKQGNIALLKKKNIMSKYKIYLFVVPVSIIVIGITVVTVHYVREINATRETLNQLGSQVADTACGPIEYARVGQGNPVLAIHGALGGFDAGLMLAQPAIAAGYQVISVSRFGYLRSPMPENASVDKQADAYACLLDALGIQKVAVMTASGGAVSTIRFAVRYPERISAIIMLSPASPGKVQVAPPPQAALSIMRSDFLYWALVIYFRPVAQKMVGVPDGLALSPESQASVNATLAATLPSSQRIDGFTFDNFDVTDDFNEEISDSSPNSVKGIKAPVLIFNALDDPYAVPENVRGMAKKIPNARLFILPDGGHLLLGHSDEVSAEVIQFLHSNTAGLN